MRKKITILFVVLSTFFQKSFAQNFIYELHQNTIFVQKSQSLPLIYSVCYLDTKTKLGVWSFMYFEPGTFEILIGPKFSFIKTNKLECELGLGVGYNLIEKGSMPSYGGYFWFTSKKYDFMGYAEQDQNTFLWWSQFYTQRHIGKFAIGPGYQTSVGYGLKFSYLLNRWEFYTQPSLDDIDNSKEQKILFGIRFHN